MGSTPFFCAVEDQHRKICQLLIEWGCDVHAKNLKNNTAFDGIQSEEFRNFLLSYHADWSSAIPLISQGDTNVLHNIVRSLVNRKNFMSSPTSRCINGSTLLHTATYFGRTDIVKILLHLKIDVNLQDYKGATALHRARDTDTIQLLTDHGADVNWSDGDGNMPLHMMSYGELTKPARLDCLKLLLSQKPTIGSLNKKDLLPIHCAAMQGRIDIIQLLLQFDTEEQIISKLMAAKSPSILYLSVANNHVECAQWLTEKGFGFKPDEQEELLFGLLQDEMGVQRKVQCLEFLIRNGVDINAVDKQGDSALHLAACKDNCNDLLMLLPANNAEVNTLNRDHSTPLFHAVQASNYYGTSLLIQHGVNTKKANNQGFRAFDLIQDYQEWIESGFFTNEITSLLKAYELDRSCSLVRNINMKLKMVEASQKLPVFNSQLKQSFFWFKT
ncbi:putative ankyrin repeat protein RF_0381 isoform X1 [Hypanus sabinus]|uniref:putative ankyrin repeat protein RF_0381 isoform X1 n=2 Tax=Hypanus sabinus TaxID=79690 RepID=UPI0028C425B5|nr:putative ankyrin repeat protein RF_0381 isoform X1 [Hypanus sabinus]XP_059834384.1 putative ankyrin repeat protein RF_0381 isoform X1 [Hypanus sabinus]